MHDILCVSINISHCQQIEHFRKRMSRGYFVFFYRFFTGSFVTKLSEGEFNHETHECSRKGMREKILLFDYFALDI